MTNNTRGIDRSKFEILLLAVSLLILVSILGIVLLFGVGIRASRARADSESHESLRDNMRWEEDDVSELNGIESDEGFAEGVRRRSMSLAGGVQRELGEFTRKMSTGSTNSMHSTIKDLEGTCSRGLRRLSNDFSALLKPATDRHHDIELLIDVPEVGAASARHTESLGARRRSSRVMFLDASADASSEA